MIGEINGHQTAIATALQEQTAVTAEINRGINEVLITSADITTNISQVAEATEATSAQARQAEQVAVNLSDKSGQLQELIAEMRA